VQRLEEFKPYWLPWVESVASRALVSRSGGRKSRAPFFVVLRGRLRGILTRGHVVTVKLHVDFEEASWFTTSYMREKKK